MMGFEDMTRREGGVEFQWEELLAFSKELTQIVDGDLTASSQTSDGEAILFIEVFDSTEWTIAWGEPLELRGH